MDSHDTHAAGMIRPLVLAALLVSGLIHLSLTRAHLVASPILGLGFAMVAVLQLAFGMRLLLRPAQHLGAGALILAVFSLAVYVIVRLAGLPLAHGHQGGLPLTELVCKGAEVLTIGGLLLSSHLVPLPVRAARIRARAGRRAYLMALVATGLLTAIVASYVGSALMPPHRHDQPHEHAAAWPAGVPGGHFKAGATQQAAHVPLPLLWSVATA